MQNKDRDILDILYLFYLSKQHKNLTIANFLRLVLPPLASNQYLIKRVDNKIVAVATWAFLSKEVFDKYTKRKYELQPKDWQTGDMYYLVNFVSPFGHTKQFFKELIEHVKSLGVKQANYYVLRHKRLGSVKL